MRFGFFLMGMFILFYFVFLFGFYLSISSIIANMTENEGLSGRTFVSHRNIPGRKPSFLKCLWLCKLAAFYMYKYALIFLFFQSGNLDNPPPANN